MKPFILLQILILSNACQSQTQPDKEICQECNKKDSQGRKQGLWIEDNGLREVYYKNDLMDGLIKVYSRKTGKLQAFGEYKNGSQSGIWYYFNEKSQLMFKEFDIAMNNGFSVTTDDGTKVKPKFKSYFISFHPNGMVEEEGLALYDEDIEIDFFKSGIWKHYDAQGRLIKTTNN